MHHVVLAEKNWSINLAVSENRGTPKSSILIGFSSINHPFWGTIIFGNTHLEPQILNHIFSILSIKFLSNSRIFGSHISHPIGRVGLFFIETNRTLSFPKPSTCPCKTDFFFLFSCLALSTGRLPCNTTPTSSEQKKSNLHNASHDSTIVSAPQSFRSSGKHP